MEAVACHESGVPEFALLGRKLEMAAVRIDTLQRERLDSIDDGGKYRARIAALEAALRVYGRHGDNCPVNGIKANWNNCACNCGLQYALTTEATDLPMETVVKCPECCCSYIAGSDHASVCPDRQSKIKGEQQ
jgi:hypothetical protein